MGERPDEIEAQISTEREQLGRDVSELQSTVRETLYWKNQVRERPELFLGAAFGVGLLFSLFVPRR